MNPSHGLRFLKRVAIVLAIAGMCPLFAAAQNPLSAGNQYVDAKLISDRISIQPEGINEGSPAKIGVLFTIKPGWHIYWKNSGESAIPTKIAWKLPEGWRTSDLQWPAPRKFAERGNITTFGYTEEVLLMSDLFPLSGAAATPGPVTVQATVKFLVCRDVCVPGQANLSANFNFSAEAPLEVSPESPMFEKYEALLPREAASLKDFSWEVVTSSNSATPKSMVNGAILLKQLKPKSGQGTEQYVQFFPQQNSGVEIVHAEGAALKDDNSSYLVTFPIKISADAKEGDLTLKGNIAVAGDVTSDGHDTVFEWSLPIHVLGANGTAQADTHYVELLGKAGRPVPLSYRLVVHKENGESTGNLAAKAPVAPAATEAPAAAAPGKGAQNVSLLYALLCAFIGGLLLNFMPCVLPIISIKVMGFVGSAGESKSKGRADAFAFSAGILGTFFALATIVVVMRTFGYQLGWGFQFQHPEFIFGLAMVVFLLSLGFFDVYTISLPGLQGANRAVSKLGPSFAKHFFDGVLATALSTPCTAPFLGVSLVLAFSQPWPVTYLLFMTVGFGLALPYAYLSTQPKLLALLPKPGAWMYRVRQFMGFCLLGTVIWLLFVLESLSNSGSIWALALMLLLYVFFWVRSWTKESGSPRGKYWNAAAFIIVLFAFLRWYPSIVGAKDTSAKIAWIPYSKEVVQQARNNGQAVFLDFTAEWCITCKANEFLTLNTSEVTSSITDLGILPVKADWTDGNDEVTAALKSYGAEGVPLYVVLPGNPEGTPIVLSTLPSASSLIEAFKKVSIATTKAAAS